MRFAVAIASPPNFPHSKAFEEVAETLHHGLRSLGHDSVLTNRLDLDERRTIVLGGNVLIRHGLKPPKYPIFYNLEQLGDDLPSMTLPAFVDLFRRYPTWDYSQANIEYVAARGLPRPTYVPIGYVPELTRIAPAPKDIDVLFYGASYERRYAILKDLHDRGFRVKWLSGVYGASRDAWIARSKIILNLHYWDSKIFEIVRVSYLLANRGAVVSERGADPSLERDFASGVAFADYDELVDRCVELLGDEPARRELAERGYQAFTARDQDAILDRALSKLDDVIRDTSARDGPCISEHPDGQDHNAELQLRERQLFRHKLVPDRDLWLAKVEHNPEDARSVFFLAEICFQIDDFVNARTWYARRVEMGGCDEEAYWAMYRLAASMEKLDESWPDVQDAYLKAWEFRPTRAEALYAIAFRCRGEQRYRDGYQFAKRANAIPFPEEDLFVLGYFAEIYAWRATDEQATCAYWIGRHTEAFTLCRRLLALPDLPDADRQRIATNRDFSVPAMIDAAAPYPDTMVQSPTAGPRDAEITVTLIAGPDRSVTERTLNSFFNCCLDVPRVGRLLVLDTGLSAPDRALLQQRYGFLEFADCGADARMVALRAQIDGRFWLHLGEGWRFFAPENYITRLNAVLEAEPEVFQVGVNVADAAKLTGACAAESAIRRAPDGGRYLLTETMSRGPAMFDTARLDRAVAVQKSDADPPAQRRRPATDAGPRTATLDEVLCISYLHL
jgi:tetratricopeptide (TPR) repeat protein